MINTIVKRDGRCVLFDIDKITDAIFKAAQALGGNDRQTARELAELVAMHVEQAHADGNPPTVEECRMRLNTSWSSPAMPAPRRNISSTGRSAPASAI